MSASKYLVTADCLVMSLHNEELSILLIKRDQEPYRGKWAIPGGFIDINETAERTALRKLKEETNVCDIMIEQIHTFSSPDRDPRGRVISVVFLALIPFNNLAYSTGQRSQDAQVFSVSVSDGILELKTSEHSLYEYDLAFDHGEIIKYVINHMRNQANQPKSFK